MLQEKESHHAAVEVEGQGVHMLGGDGLGGEGHAPETHLVKVPWAQKEMLLSNKNIWKRAFFYCSHEKKGNET